MTYAEKLRDPRWQKKRLEIMERDEWCCQWCSATTSTLNVDHKIYRQGFNPWDYNDDDLQTLCEDCHKVLTKRRQAIADQIGRMDEPMLIYLEEFMSIARDDMVTIVGWEIFPNKNVSSMTHRQWKKFVEVMLEHFRKKYEQDLA